MAGYIFEDRWTTQEGEWFVSNRKYSIDQAHVDQWGNEKIEGKGCSICIFVKLDGGPADTVHYYTTGGYSEDHPVDTMRWSHTTMYNPGSGYNPNRTTGPWAVTVEGVPSVVVDDIGLPEGEHVSHYIVLKWSEQEGGVIPPPVAERIAVTVLVGADTYRGEIPKA